MKLYTEEQMIQAYDAGFQDFKEGLIGRSYYVVESIMPIELLTQFPSDDEIKIKIIKDVFAYQYLNGDYEEGFQDGALWLKELITNKNK